MLPSSSDEVTIILDQIPFHAFKVGMLGFDRFYQNLIADDEPLLSRAAS